MTRLGPNMPRGFSPRSIRRDVSSRTAHTRDARRYTVRDLLVVIFKRQKLIAVVFAVVAAIGAIRAFTTPPSYEVTAAILLKKPGVDRSITAEGSRPMVQSVTPEDLNSEIEILKNRRLIEQVAQNVETPAPTSTGIIARATSAVKDVMGAQRLSPLQTRVLEISNNLDFRAIEQSHVVELGFKTENPVWGTEVLASLIDRYLDFRIQVHQAPLALTLLDERTNDALNRLTDAEEALEEFIEQTGVSSALDDQMRIALQRLDQLERDATEASVSVEQQRQRVEILKARLGAEPARLRSASRENADPQTEQLSRALVDLRLQRDDLLTRGFSETSVRVRDIQTRIDLAEQRLEDTNERIGINQTEVNPLHENIRSELVRSEAELVGFEARYTALQQEVRNTLDKVKALNQRMLPMRRLDRDATSAEESYILLKRQRDETQITQAMDQQNAVSVSVAREPIRPLLPEGHSKKVVLLYAVCLGIAVAFGVAFAMEYLDRSFTAPDDLEQQINITVLGSIPEWDQRYGSMLPAPQHTTEHHERYLPNP